MFKFDPFLPQYQDDPYPYYRELRERYPAYKIEGRDIWLVSRYADIMDILKNPKTWSSQANGNVINDSPERIGRTLGTTDPPRHEEMRKMLSSVFTPASVARQEPLIRAAADRLIDDIASQDECDLMKQFIEKLTASVIGYLLGIPDRDHDQLRQWTSTQRFDEQGRFLESRKQAEDNLVAYTQELVRERSKNPQNDLTSDLIRLKAEGANLTEEDIVMTVRTIISAAFESTNLMFGNTLNALSLHPDQLVMVEKDLSLLPNAIEEAVRWDTSAQGFQRTTTEDVVVGGTLIPRNTKVFVLYASGNRDESQFENAEHFDITRKPGKHLGFGWGPHVCIGAPLARLEMRIGIEQLLTRLGHYEIDRLQTVRRKTTPQFRGFSKLQVRFSKKK